MELIICKDYEELSQKASEIIISMLKENPKSILGLATGSTPEGMYANLVKANENNEISFKDVKTFNLDEYYGLDPENDQSYRYFMNDKLFNHVDINKEYTRVPSGTIENPEEYGKKYDEEIENAGGTDIQVLGIGANGHIGFNEPSDVFTPETHLVKLTEKTISDNSRFFENIDDVPKEAITMGMKSIMSAKKVLLIANGKNKADAIYKTLRGPIDPKVPASILQVHPDLVVILDEDAASLL